MKIKVIDYGGKYPERAHYNDSGADCFCQKDVMIFPNQTKKIPTGIGVNLPDGYDLVVHCKSGLSSKGIWAANAPVDAGYTGEIHAILCNFGRQPVTIRAAEFVRDLEEERGDSGFGSTGR